MNKPDEQNRKLTEEMLDAALAEYSNVEPRLGLDSRILSRLAASQPKPESWSRWWPAMALVCAALIVAAFIYAPARRSDNPVKQSATNQGVTEPPAVHTDGPPISPHSRLPRRSGRSIPKPPKSVPLNRAELVPVKQPIFPAPSPLTDQERLLFAYLRRTHADELAKNAKPDDQPVLQNQLNEVLPGPRFDSNKNTR